MSHFMFENALTEITRMDAPIEHGPMLRWQRKALESGMRTMSLTDAAGNGKTSASGAANVLRSVSVGRKSPLHSPQVEKLRSPAGAAAKTQHRNNNNNKTPAKQTAASEKHGLKHRTKTPNKTPQADRFIPNRSSMDIEVGHFRLMSGSDVGDAAAEGGETDYQRHVSEALGGHSNAKILSFKEKAPEAKEGTTGNLKVLYACASVNGKSAACTRVIPQQPERILDAPELLDDYYLNLLSWSAVSNLVALALGPSVYLWNASNGSIMELCELTATEDYVSSLSWLREDNVLAIGNSLGAVQIWDVSSERHVRTMSGHASRVGSLSWNTHMLSSGSRSGAIHQHDVRVFAHHVGTLANHTQEVCGLQWSDDGHYLASGANDNLLCVWDSSASGPNAIPVHTFSQHQAAVKAIAWCPWQSSLLASGGGTADRQIRFWNVSSGDCVQTTETNSQVCAIIWSTHYRELISGHGYSQNQLTLWKYPAMARIADLFGHTSRILALALSPDGTTVASAAADETLRFWKCFDSDKRRKTVNSKSSVKESTSSQQQLGGLSLCR